MKNGHDLRLKRFFADMEELDEELLKEEIEAFSLEAINENRSAKPMVRPNENSHWGIDACGDEIFHGDTIFQFPNGEIVLYENLTEYLIRLGVKEKTAK